MIGLMSLETIVSMLQRHALFSRLDRVRLEVIAFSAETLSFAPGATVCEAGTLAEGALLVLDGEAAMFLEEEGGRRALRLDSGDLIGETALIEPRSWQATVRAVSALEAVRLRRDIFQRLIAEFPEMGQLVTAHLADRLEELQDDLGRLKARLQSAKPVSRAKRAEDEKQGEGINPDVDK